MKVRHCARSANYGSSHKDEFARSAPVRLSVCAKRFSRGSLQKSPILSPCARQHNREDPRREGLRLGATFACPSSHPAHPLRPSHFAHFETVAKRTEAGPRSAVRLVWIFAGAGMTAIQSWPSSRTTNIVFLYALVRGKLWARRKQIFGKVVLESTAPSQHF